MSILAYLHTKMKNKKIQYFEIALYCFVALIAFSVPFFIRFEDGREWSFIFKNWERLLPFVFIFLVNNFLLLPKLLLKSKFPAYIVSCLLLLLTVTFLNNYMDPPKLIEMKPEPGNKMKFERRPPLHFEDSDELEKREDFHHPRHEQKGDKHFGKHPSPSKAYFNFPIFIIGLLIIGFNSGIRIFVFWMNEREERSEKERQYLSTELAFLRQQISPHFFMNTLNNIHSLVDINSEEAKNSIIKLSKLMRYLLYETDADKVPLNKEIEFIESYVELMRLRYDETMLSIELVYPDEIHEISVPSLLFLPLIENAFKHGVKNNKKSFIDIEFKLSEISLMLNIKNSNFKKTKKELDEASGIGLENIRKRLELIYKTNYVLIIDSKVDTYEISLAIPIRD